MALETLTFDFNATFFPLVPDFIAAFEDCLPDAPNQYSASELLNAAKKPLDDDDEFEDDDDEEEEDDEDEDGEYEDDDEEVEDDDDDEDEYEDDEEEDEDDDEEDEDDDDVDELQVRRR